MERFQLDAQLKALLGSDKVYFQPPVNLTMEYPCIVYQRDAGDTQFAGNLPYRFNTRYQVTLIARVPDLDTFQKLTRLPMCLYDRFYTVDNLNHDVFTIFI